MYKNKRAFGRNKKRSYFKYLFVAMVLVAAYWWYQESRYEYFINTPVDPTDTTNETFIVKDGENTTSVAKNLFENNLIIDEDAFKKYAKSSGNDTKLIAGRFIIQRNQTIPQVVETITNPRRSEEVITIPEGSTVVEIDNTLADKQLISNNDFINAVNEFDDYEKYEFLDREKMEKLVHPLEGYLFPDTYFVDPINFYSENLIQLMLQNFENKLAGELGKDHDRDFNDIIVMASIVEKEVRTSDDIPIVAGILWKRLDNGWLLGADATLLYLAEDRDLDYYDLQEDTPYNTRLNPGLPPGPICNPGLKHIMATIYPEDSEYWYYLTTLDTGEVIYAETNDQHNQNKREHLY